jgi:hypothetical protein
MLHLILLYFIIQIERGEECKWWRSSLCSFLEPTVTSSFLDPNILLSTLFSNTVSLCLSLNFRDDCSFEFKTSHRQPHHCYRYFLDHGVTCRGDLWRDFGLDVWIIHYTFTHSGLQTIQRYRYSTHFNFTVTHALDPQSSLVVSRQRIYHSLTVTSNHTWSLLSV